MMNKKFLIALAALSLAAAAVAAPQRRNAAKSKARPKTEKVGAAELIGKINDKIKAYDFDGAREDLEKYEDTKDASEQTARRLEDRINLGSSMLERVQKIEVIDSIAVDKATFFDAYRLNPAAGSLSPASTLPAGFSADSATVVYSTESGERRLWGAPRPDGKGSRIVQTSLLADGSWESPAALDDAVNGDSHNANYPFVMSDGITLYYASDCPATSLGGYDIYITRFDGEKYLEPQNIGMPFNSTADDFLLAIDETTGAGWWATDRNNLGDKLTVYLFIPSEIRVNYPPDTPGLADLAKLTDFKATRPRGADYSRLIKALSAPVRHDHAADDEFEFAMPDGRVIRNLGELSSERARNAMEDYLDRIDDLNYLLLDLADWRSGYAAGDSSLASRILEGEKEESRIRADIRRLATIAVETEMRGR